MYLLLWDIGRQFPTVTELFATHEVFRRKIEKVTDEDTCNAIFNMIFNVEVETVQKPRLNASTPHVKSKSL